MSGGYALSEAWTSVVGTAFPAHFAHIVEAVAAHPAPTELAKLFEELAHTVDPAERGSARGLQSNGNSKKRKWENEASRLPLDANGVAPSTAIDKAVVWYECRDVSFQAPARKKLKLQIVCDTEPSGGTEVRLLHPQTEDVEHAVPTNGIEQAFCLPVPEKQQRQSIFIIFPKADATDANGAPLEQIVFTMAEAAPAGASLPLHPATGEDTYITVTERELNRSLHSFGKTVVKPSEQEFASSIPQPHRKGEKAYHVKAHRGSKEGYLFFLENGIVFGFKKPLAFFPFSSIESISYTSVLQRTFNLVIAVTEGDESTEAREVEFSMLDQADFAGIDEYIKRHELNDASMAAERRARAYNVNKDKKADANGNADAGAGEDQQSELQKAEQQLQDDEDELEEDYEDSGGDSDGEGEYSEEEYGDADDEEGAEEVELEEDVHDEDTHDG